MNNTTDNQKNELIEDTLTNMNYHQILDSIVVSIPACHAGDRGSIPRRGDFLSLSMHYL